MLIIKNLEDCHEDILGKAMRGLGIGKNEMAQRLGVGKPEIEAILSGGVDENLINAMAGELELDGEKLIQSALKNWSPAPVLLRGLRQISSVIRRYDRKCICGLGRRYTKCMDF